MRFSYVDSRGREIEVDSVEALALRIELGAVGPDTRLYDAVSDRWAPAKEHPVYRSLAGEDPESGDEAADGGQDAPSEGAAGAAGDASPPDRAGVPDRDEAPGSPSDEEDGPEDSDRSAASEPTTSADDPLGLGFDLTMADEVEEVDEASGEGDEASGEGDESSGPAGREDATPARAGEGEESPGAPEPDDGEAAGSGGRGGDPWERYPALPDDAPAPSGPGAEPAGDAPEPSPEGAEPFLEGADPFPEGADERAPGPGPADGDRDDSPEANDRRDGAAEEPLDVEGGPGRTGAGSPRERDGDREGDGDEEELPPWVAEGEALWKGETILPDGGASGPAASEPDPPEADAAAGVDRSPPPGEAGGAEDGAPGEVAGTGAGSTEAPRAEPARGATSRSRRSRRRDRRSLRGVRLGVLGLVGALAVGTAVWAVEAGPWAEPAEPAEPAPLSPELREVTAEVSVAAYEDVLTALEDELRGRPLPERPPEPWLSGLYLSSASGYPGVESYWRDVRDAVASARSRESGLFRLRLDERIEARSGGGAGSAALDPDEVARVRDEAVRAYERSAVRRDSLYAGILEVAETSLRLHALLVEREEDVEYEPYSDPGVSRDPVLEAVAEDTVLRREMNDRLDAFLEAVEGYGVPRPITTTGLLDHLFEGLRRVDLPEPRRRAEPESTTTAERPPPQPMGAS